jgi:hypothetical protein
MKQLVRNAIDLLLIARGNVSLLERVTVNVIEGVGGVAVILK